MSQAGLIEIVASQQSPQINALDALATGSKVSLWSVSFHSINNFSQEHNECTLSTQPTGTRAGQRLTFRVSKAGDLMTSCWLECVAPKLAPSVTGGLVSYVHALGYAMIQSVQFMVSNHSQEDVPGQWQNIAEELHTPCGRRVTTAVFKHDRITLPEMAKLSSDSDITMLIPLRLFFTAGPGTALPICAMSCHDIDIVVTLVGIEDIAFALAPTMAADCAVTTDGTALLKWDDFSFRLWAGQVYLDTTERTTYATSDHSILMKTVHTYTSYAQAEGYAFSGRSINLTNLPFNHPLSSLVWVVADKFRRAKYLHDVDAVGSMRVDSTDAPTAGSELIPFTDGVRALYGQMASGKVGIAQGSLSASNADWNVIREGAKAVSTVGSTKILSSAGVKEHRADRQNGSLHLPGDVFDYRLARNTGTTAAPVIVEIEPIKSVQLKFNNQDRFDTNLKPQYFNLVTTAQHFQNVPPKGIYAYSFAQNASSVWPNGTVNASRIDDKTLEIHRSDDYTPNTTSAAGGATDLEAYIYAEHYQVFSVKKNSVGRLFGN